MLAVEAARPELVVVVIQEIEMTNGRLLDLNSRLMRTLEDFSKLVQ